MSFVIAIDTPRWRAHQDRVRDAVGAAGATLVPVAKGNGYGVGNLRLAAETARLGLPTVAVGTVHEAAAVLSAQPGLDVLVLEPLMLGVEEEATAWRALAARPDAARLIATVSSLAGAEDAASLGTPERPWRILLEGLTSIYRFGLTEDEMARAVARLAAPLAAGSVVLEGLALHLPIAAPERPRVASMALLTSAQDPPAPVVVGSARVHEVVAWGLLWPTLLANLTGIADAGTLWVSHLDDRECADVRAALPEQPIAVRIGTRLWLGDRRALRARGRVLAVHATNEGQSAGYHQRRAPRDGHIVVVSGGTSHGVAMTAPRPALSVRQRAAAAGEGALEAAGRFRAPFHLAGGSTTWFHEPPHMHVSLLRLSRGEVPPAVGDLVDCDVRFTTVHPDVVLG
jgi:Alanine racemase, N-terminal domain